MSERNADSGSAPPERGLGAWAILFAGLCAWLVFDLAYPNVYGGTDVFHFKDAGCNLAAGRGFVSAAFVGSESFDEKLWFSQGPLFPILYGAYASLFGCTFASDNVFDLLVAAALSATVLALAGRGLTPRMRIVFAAALAVVLPSGGLYWPSDRPDHFALLLALLVPLAGGMGGDGRRPGGISRRTAPLLAGLAFAASPFYGLIGLALAVLQAVDHSDPLSRASIGRAAGTVAVFAAVPVAAVAAFAAYDPGTVVRFATHLSILFASKATFLERIDHAVNSSGFSSRIVALRWLAAFVFAGWLFGRALRRGGGPRVWIVPAALFLMVLGVPAAFPHQGNYYAAAALIVSVLAPYAIQPGAAGAPRMGRGAFGISMAVVFLPLLPALAISVLQRIESYPSFQREAQRVVSMAGLADRLAVAPPSHYFLFRPTGARLFNPAYLGPTHDLRAVDYQIVCRTALPLGAPLEALSPGFVPMDGDVGMGTVGPPVPIVLFGRTLMARDWGWSCRIYRNAGAAGDRRP